MNRADVVKCIKESNVFYLTTVDDGKPRVRPYGFIMDYDGRICFTTNKNKPTYQQIIANPYVEICAMQNGYNWIRLNGKAVKMTSADSKNAALSEMPMLAENYAIYGGDFEVFGLEAAVVDYYSFGSTGEIIKESCQLD